MEPGRLAPGERSAGFQLHDSSCRKTTTHAVERQLMPEADIDAACSRSWRSVHESEGQSWSTLSTQSMQLGGAGRIHHASSGSPAATVATPGQRASIISRTRGVHEPPHRPVVAVVFAATCAIVSAPASIALSIVPYLMLLQRQTVMSFFTAGWTSFIAGRKNKKRKRSVPRGHRGSNVETRDCRRTPWRWIRSRLRFQLSFSQLHGVMLDVAGTECHPVCHRG